MNLIAGSASNVFFDLVAKFFIKLFVSSFCQDNSCNNEEVGIRVAVMLIVIFFIAVLAFVALYKIVVYKIAFYKKASATRHYKGRRSKR